MSTVSGRVRFRVPVRQRLGDIALDAFIKASVLLLAAVTLYPFLYVLAVSFSDPAQVAAGRVGIWPVSPTIETYRRVLGSPNMGRGYANTLLYVVTSTAINVGVTVAGAYALSRRRMVGKGILMVFITFTMLFSGGMIPTYMVVRALGMINTIWAVIIPGVVGPWVVIIAVTFMKGIPDSLEDSAAVDGANDLQTLLAVFVPLLKPLVAVLVLFKAVGMWNSFFGPFIYLSDKAKWPLQLFIRQIVIEGTMQEEMLTLADDKIKPVELAIKMTTVSVTIIPIICVYPFLQKYFVKGVMIGALKD